MRCLILVVSLVFAISSMKAVDVASQVDAIMKTRYDYDTPGAGIMILKGDSVIMEKYYGVADMETKEPISMLTRFNIASVSKQFTVVGALRLVNEGKIALNDSLANYFPQYTEPFWKQLQVWHLMSHTSGLPDSRDRRDRNACVYANDSISMSYFPSVKELLFQPGSAYDYKNPTFLLIANIIEQCENMPFIKYQKRHIFDVLGMVSTTYFDPKNTPANTAHGYINTKADGTSSTDNDTAGKTIKVDNSNSSQWQQYDYGEETFFATRPDGGIYSTVRDLAQWEKGLRENRIIPDSLLQTAYSPLVEVSGSKWSSYQNRPNTYYGLGWFIDKSPGYPTKVYHTGDNGGFQAYLAKYPEKEVTIIILENRNDNDRWSLATAIDKILLDAGLLK